MAKQQYKMQKDKPSVAQDPIVSYQTGSSVSQLTKDSFEQDWQRGMSVEQFQKECVARLKTKYYDNHNDIVV